MSLILLGIWVRCFRRTRFPTSFYFPNIWCRQRFFRDIFQQPSRQRIFSKMLCASHRLDTFDPLVACSSLGTWRYLDPKAVCCMDRDWGRGKFVRIWECSACRQCPWWRTGLHHLPGLCGALLSHSHLFLPRYPKIQGTKRTPTNASLTQRPSFELVFEVAAVLFLIALWDGNIGSGHAHHQIAMWVWDFVNSYSPQEKNIVIKLGDSLSLVHDDHMCPLPCPTCLGVVEDVLFQGLLVGWPPTSSQEKQQYSNVEWKRMEAASA